MTVQEEETREMARRAMQAAESNTARRSARAEWDVNDAESVRLHTDPHLRYPYPSPSASSPLADHDARVLLDRLRKVRDDARSGGPPSEYVDAAAGVEHAVIALQRDWVIRPESVLQELWRLLEHFGTLIP
jgi:hypothetical protein